MEEMARNWVLKVECPLSLSCCLYPFHLPLFSVSQGQGQLPASVPLCG